ncbi:hypothetical protein [Streptomyces sp. NPDC002763]|uniref:hypothetical protein n=1 Tax=Streptomyces sp. NPDC002763 TaxID=3154427 RepID=UPI00332220E6
MAVRGEDDLLSLAEQLLGGAGRAGGEQAARHEVEDTQSGGVLTAPGEVPAGAAVAALLPVTAYLRTPGSRLDDVTAIGAAVRTAGAGADGILYLPARRRVWSLADPGTVRGLRDLALDRTPAASGTLYGTEAGPGRSPSGSRSAGRGRCGERG